MIIKNHTPYVGKIKLRFEKYPEYSGRTILNKVHLNLGFTKLVSRLEPNYLKESGREVDPRKVKLIELCTSGKIASYSLEPWGGMEQDDCNLNNSFLSKSGEYIGDIERAWWYYKNHMRVCEAYPHGVAELVGDSDVIEGYYGYTHRGGQTFRIGNRLFEANYEPKESNYEPWEWAGFVQEYNKTILEADDFDIEWIKRAGISYVIPYKMRGKKEIKTMEECLQAAINMSKELS